MQEGDVTIEIGTVGLATVFLPTSIMPRHLTAKALAARHIRPVCDLTREVRAIPLILIGVPTRWCKLV